MSDLSKRIKSLHTRSKNVGRDYVLLFCESIETMEENWTPLAELLSGANPKDNAMLRKLAGFVLSGWTVKRDTKHRTGLRFTKEAGATFDQDRIETLRTLAKQGHVLQSKKVAEFIDGGEKQVKAVSSEDLAKAFVTSTHKKIDSGAISTADALNAMRMAIKALEAELATEKMAA
jgi:hypothetical protein